jgi:YegS/Rv2252/BmrU family lipid kinase
MKETELRLFVIINPRSSNSDPAAIKSALARRLPADAYETYLLEGEDVPLRSVIGDAIERGHTGVVAAGGDGTVSAVADGVVNTAVSMGVIPTGTGNGFAQELSLPATIEEAVALVADPPATRPIDVLQIDDHYSVLRVGVGFETEVIEATERENKSALGGVAYFWTALRRAARLESNRLTITVDGQAHHWRDVRHVALVNGARLGAPGVGFRWGPHIRPDDGRIDVCIIKQMTILEYVRLFWRASQNETQREKAMRYLPAEKTIEVTAERPLPVHCDGEAVGETPFRAIVHPGAISVFVPASGDATRKAHH